MRRLIGFILISAFVPAVASAQESRPFVVMSGLFLALVESGGTYADDKWTATGDFEMDAGYGATLAFGYGATPGISGEIEVGYRTTDLSGIENVTITNRGNPETSVVGGIPADGDLDTLSFMVNGIYTFDTRVFRPYVGVGIGLAQHRWKYPGQTLGTSLGNVDVPRTWDDDVVFAYQLMVGLNWAFADNTEARAGYRYFATTEGEFGPIDAGYNTHSIDAGIAIRF